MIKPKNIITFGNQVSSIVLKQKICVSTCRKKKFELEIEGEKYNVYPTYYPVGNGMRNMNLAVEDLNVILKK